MKIEKTNSIFFDCLKTNPIQQTYFSETSQRPAIISEIEPIVPTFVVLEGEITRTSMEKFQHRCYLQQRDPISGEPFRTKFGYTDADIF